MDHFVLLFHLHFPFKLCYPRNGYKIIQFYPDIQIINIVKVAKQDGIYQAETNSAAISQLFRVASQEQQRSRGRDREEKVCLHHQRQGDDRSWCEEECQSQWHGFVVCSQESFQCCWVCWKVSIEIVPITSCHKHINLVPVCVIEIKISHLSLIDSNYPPLPIILITGEYLAPKFTKILYFLDNLRQIFFKNIKFFFKIPEKVPSTQSLKNEKYSPVVLISGVWGVSVGGGCYRCRKRNSWGWYFSQLLLRNSSDQFQPFLRWQQLHFLQLTYQSSKQQLLQWSFMSYYCSSQFKVSVFIAWVMV